MAGGTQVCGLFGWKYRPTWTECVLAVDLEGLSGWHQGRSKSHDAILTV